MKKARATGNRDGVFAGLTVFGMDFIGQIGEDSGDCPLMFNSIADTDADPLRP